MVNGRIVHYIYGRVHGRICMAGWCIDRARFGRVINGREEIMAALLMAGGIMAGWCMAELYIIFMAGCMAGFVWQGGALPDRGMAG